MINNRCPKKRDTPNPFDDDTVVVMIITITTSRRFSHGRTSHE